MEAEPAGQAGRQRNRRPMSSQLVPSSRSMLRRRPSIPELAVWVTPKALNDAFARFPADETEAVGNDLDEVAIRRRGEARRRLTPCWYALGGGALRPSRATRCPGELPMWSQVVLKITSRRKAQLHQRIPAT